MKAEKFLISAVAMVIGVTIAGLAFYIYQSQKTIPKSQIQVVAIKAPTPTPKKGIFLSIDSPQNEEVTDSKTIKISGKTIPQATLVITSNADSEVVSPANNGDFSVTLTITDGENQLEVSAVSPTGETTTQHHTITYSTESF